MKSSLQSGLRFAAVVAFLAFAGGCSNWVLGVVQSFGSPNGAKISTIVGNGTAGYTGDNGPAGSAEINQPYGIAADSSGNLYIADNRNNVVRMVDKSANITTVATGLNGPVGVAVNASGDVYIADTSNWVVLKIDHATRSVSTVAGNGNQGSSGNGGPATSAQLDYPYGIAVDSSGNLYIAQLSINSVVRKVDTSGIITTVAGKGTPGYSGDGGLATNASLNYPQAVAVDSSGNLYIADSSNYLIRKVAPNGIISTVAGTGINGHSGDGGPATAAEVNFPEAVTVDPAGNLYISEGDNIVRKVDTSGNISTVAGNVHLAGGYGGDGNVATAATLFGPWGLAFDPSGNLLIADRLNHRIRKVGFGG